MTELHQDLPDAPVWARADAFPKAPAGWGWADIKCDEHPCDSYGTLTAAIRDDPDGRIALVWTPYHTRMLLPEQLTGMGEALRAARTRWSQEDLASANHRLRWFGTVLITLVGYSFYQGLSWASEMAAKSGVVMNFSERVEIGMQSALSSFQSGIALLLFVIFAFIPWYQARKRRLEIVNWTDASAAEAVPVIRFETWLAQQKAPLTKVFLVMMALVALVQIVVQLKSAESFSIMKLLTQWGGTSSAGLLKENYQAGEFWRLFTAPFLHGNFLHFFMNASALAYLGKRMEVFARWPHLPLVFLFAACIGGEASARFIGAPSVGASGGLMGWLGFLLVFEILHRRLVPRRATRRLAAGVFLTALIGLIGYKYIDNAAHAGGLIAGMLYAAIVFPASSSPIRPRSNFTDRMAGILALSLLAAAAMLAIWKMLVN